MAYLKKCLLESINYQSIYTLTFGEYWGLQTPKHGTIDCRVCMHARVCRGDNFSNHLFPQPDSSLIFGMCKLQVETNY